MKRDCVKTYFFHDFHIKYLKVILPFFCVPTNFLISTKHLSAFFVALKCNHKFKYYIRVDFFPTLPKLTKAVCNWEQWLTFFCSCSLLLHSFAPAALFVVLPICYPCGQSGVWTGLNATVLISVFHRIFERLTPGNKLSGFLHSVHFCSQPPSVSDFCVFFLLTMWHVAVVQVRSIYFYYKAFLIPLSAKLWRRSHLGLHCEK